MRRVDHAQVDQQLGVTGFGVVNAVALAFAGHHGIGWAPVGGQVAHLGKVIGTAAHHQLVFGLGAFQAGTVDGGGPTGAAGL